MKYTHFPGVRYNVGVHFDGDFMRMRGLIGGLGVALVLLPALPALAGPRDDVKAGTARCDAFADDRTWLDCYYGAAQPMRAQLGLAPAPNSQIVLVPQALPGVTTPAPLQLGNTTANGRPGFFARLMTHTVVKAEPPTHMTAYTFDKAGIFTVTLANGEVWTQDNLDTTRAKWRGAPASLAVTIEPGPKMKVGAHELYSVVRVR